MSGEAQWVIVGQFPISNIVKHRCVLAPTLLSIFFIILLHEEKEDQPGGICIRFRTDSSLFNLWRFLARMKLSRNSSLSCYFLTTVPFSPTRRKPYSISSTASLM